MEETVTARTYSGFQLGKKFGDSTTMHGVRRALNSKSPLRRIVWSVLVLCAVAWGLSRLIDVVQDYYTYPVNTVVSLRHENQMMFPAITICNINNLKSSMIPDMVKDVLYTELTGDDRQDIINTLIRYIDSDVRNSAGHRMSDMLISCWFNRISCNSSDFYEVDTGIYGKCYTFDFWNEKKMLIGRPGPQNGLVIEMSIEYDEYISLSNQAGVKVIVHESTEVPFPEDGGVLVSPGMATSIALRKTILRRLPSPYGTCVNPEGGYSSDFNMFELYRYFYSENACRKSCYQISLYEKCNCCDPDLPCIKEKIFKVLGKTPDNQSSLKMCNSTADELFCVSEVETLFLQGELNCSSLCPPACDQTTFDTVVSTALWPSDPYLDVVLYYANQTVLKNRTFDSSDDLRKFIKRDFLRLEVFYETLNTVKIVTKPMYDWSNLLGDIGGHLGLCLGFSILTGLELIELFLDMVFFCIRRLQRQDKAKENALSLEKCGSKTHENDHE